MCTLSATQSQHKKSNTAAKFTEAISNTVVQWGRPKLIMFFTQLDICQYYYEATLPIFDDNDAASSKQFHQKVQKLHGVFVYGRYCRI